MIACQVGFGLNSTTKQDLMMLAKKIDFKKKCIIVNNPNLYTMTTLTTIARIVLAIFLIVLGSNGFFNFLPYPEMSDSANAFMGAINSAKFIFPLIGLIEIVSGILLLAKKAMPFALIMVLPILVNAMIFHVSLNPEGMLFATICFVCNIFLLYHNRESYKTLY